MQFASLLRRRLAYGAGHPDPRQDSLRRPPGRRDPLSQRRPHPRVDEVAGLAGVATPRVFGGDHRSWRSARRVAPG